MYHHSVSIFSSFHASICARSCSFREHQISCVAVSKTDGVPFSGGGGLLSRVATARVALSCSESVATNELSEFEILPFSLLQPSSTTLSSYHYPLHGSELDVCEVVLCVWQFLARMRVSLHRASSSFIKL